MKSVSLILFCLWISSGGMLLQGQIIDYSTLIRIEKGRRITERSFQLQINNKDQEGLAAIEIPYSASQDLDILDAYVVDRKGKTVRKLKKKEVTTRSHIAQNTFYQDDFIQSFQLNWHEFPYQIHYTYRITEKEFIYVARWQPVRYTKVPTIRASLQLEVPADYPVAIDYSPALAYHTETRKDQVLHQWNITAIEAPKAELLSPPFLEKVPMVTVVPREFDYAIKGSMQSWAQYGDWHERLNTGLDELPEREGRVVDKLLEGMTDKREIIRRLYHHLQDHTRYINVAIDVGGLQPYPAAYVSKNKYGDCKALTIYMKALLKWAGIPAHYVVIHAGSNPVRIKEELPSQQFNHVILGVPLEGDTIWLENTAGYLPFNYLGTFTQNRMALWVDGSESKLVRTPAMELPEVLERTNYRFKLNEAGRGEVSIEQDLRGKTFENLRYAQRELTGNLLQERIEENIPLARAELIDWKIVRQQRDQTDLALKLHLRLEDQLRKIGNLLVLQPPAIGMPDPEPPSRRTQPVRIPYPLNQQEELLYELPFLSKYRVELPRAQKLTTPFGQYTETYTRQENSILISRHWQLFRGDYSLAEYPEWYEFIEAVKHAQKQSAVVLTTIKGE